jgi:hypothetical protein
MERTKKAELVMQDCYTTPPGFGAKQGRLIQSSQVREKRNCSVYSVATDYKKVLETTMPSGWTKKGIPRHMLELRGTLKLDKDSVHCSSSGRLWLGRRRRNLDDLEGRSMKWAAVHHQASIHYSRYYV